MDFLGNLFNLAPEIPFFPSSIIMQIKTFQNHSIYKTINGGGGVHAVQFNMPVKAGLQFSPTTFSSVPPKN